MLYWYSVYHIDNTLFFYYIKCYMNKPLDRLDPMTLHGIMRAMMSATYEDAIDARSSANLGVVWKDEESRCKELEHALCTLSQCVENAMMAGELTPFKGDYITWLENIGLVTKRDKVNNETAKE